MLWVDSDSRNLGVQALARGAVHVLDAAGFDAECQSFAGGPSPVQPTLRAAVSELLRPGGLASFFAGYDVVVDMAGGDSFASIYGWRQLAQIAAIRRVAVRAGVPAVLGPQTIGPFETRWSRALARWSLQGVDLILARDSMSEEFVQTELRRSAQRSTDVVFALPSPTPGPEDFDLLVNPSGLLWAGRIRDVDSSGYRSALADLVRLARARGHGVALLAHVMGNATDDDDAKACEALAEVVGGAQILRPESLDEVRAQVASARLVIGSRMHACLNALSVGTPAIAWSYSRKFEGLMGDLRWPYVVSLRGTSMTTATERTMAVLEEARLARRSAEAISDSARGRIADVISRLSLIS